MLRNIFNRIINPLSPSSVKWGSPPHGLLIESLIDHYDLRDYYFKILIKNTLSG